MTIQGATDTEVFRACLAAVPCPTRRPGDLVVRDNLAPHKSEPTPALIAAAGTEVLFLPACSPDLNPIAKMWSKLHAPLRRATPKTSSPPSPPSPKSPPKRPSAGLPPAAIAFVEPL